VEGEIAWRVPALRVPTQEASTVSVACSEAVRLFADRASQVSRTSGSPRRMPGPSRRSVFSWTVSHSRSSSRQSGYGC
jgi:hypothetical protein